MPILLDNMNSAGPVSGQFGGNVLFVTTPANNDVALATAKVITALGAVVLDGVGVFDVAASNTLLYAGIPFQIGLTTGIAATTITAIVEGVDWRGITRTSANGLAPTITKGAGNTTFSEQTSGILWSRVDTVTVTATSNLADTLAIGWIYRAGTGSASAVRIPFPVSLSGPDVAKEIEANLIGVQIIDPGGGTIANALFTRGAAGPNQLVTTNAGTDKQTLTLLSPDFSVAPTLPVKYAIVFRQTTDGSQLAKSF